MFITTDAQLLQFRAAAVRPQGRPAGGMAGIKLAAGAACSRSRGRRTARGGRGPGPDAVVVSVAGSSGRCPGWRSTIKVTPYRLYPAKGRATGGVRCQRFLKGEDRLVFAWAGPIRPGPRPSGRPGLPARPGGRRDGSGERIRQGLAAVGGIAAPR